MKKIRGPLFLLVIFGVFWWMGANLLDVDFGWHYKMGEIIAASGIPKTDPFSYTMPSFPFVDFEWGTNLIWYWLFPRIGLSGLAMIYSLIALVAIRLAVPARLSRWWLLPAVIGWAVMISRFGVRPQVLSWLFLAVVTRWIYEGSWNKWKWGYPILMLGWVNLHSSFPLGVGVVGLWLVIRSLKRQTRLVDWLPWAAGVGATLINPYGWRDWIEVIKQTSEVGFNSRNIAEWQPILARWDMGFMVAGVLAGSLIWRYRKNFHIWKKLFTIIFLAQGVMHLRHTALAVVFLAPVIAEGLQYLHEEVKNYLYGPTRLLVLYKIVVGLGIAILIMEVFLGFNTRRFFNKYFYPVGAIDYLKSHNFPRRLLASYGYGGYLIWKMPGEKLFIDGRMSNFFWQAPPGESNHIFREYVDMMKDPEKVPVVFDKYQVGTVLWPKQSLEQRVLLQIQINWLAKLLGWNGKQSGVGFLEKLEQMGWKKTFEDETAVVYEK